jgi:hypothetical protein
MSNILKIVSQRCITGVYTQAKLPVVVQFNRRYCEKTEVQPAANNDAGKGGFALAYDKHTTDLKEVKPKEDNRTFATLLRNSKLIDVSVFDHIR